MGNSRQSLPRATRSFAESSGTGELDGTPGVSSVSVPVSRAAYRVGFTVPGAVASEELDGDPPPPSPFVHCPPSGLPAGTRGWSEASAATLTMVDPAGATVTVTALPTAPGVGGGLRPRTRPGNRAGAAIAWAHSASPGSGGAFQRKGKRRWPEPRWSFRPHDETGTRAENGDIGGIQRREVRRRPGLRGAL